MDFIQKAVDLLSNFHQLPTNEKWDTPFPMGVFGTLRIAHGNSILMGSKVGSPKIEDDDRFYRHRANTQFNSHHKAFLPHFFASGLSLHDCEGDSAVFEVYDFTSENWNKMIRGVDRLESFSPMSKGRHQWGYWRTLVWMRILPDDYSHPMFTNSVLHGPKRTLDIPQNEWDQFAKCPCWVYSSIGVNTAVSKLSNDIIIWDGVD